MARPVTILTRFHDENNLRLHVPADLFCQQCSDFLSREQESDSTYSTPWLHSRLTDIHHAAQDGCHLCSLLTRSIQGPFNDEDDNVPIFLFLKANTLRIQVGNNSARHTPLLRVEPLDHRDMLSSICEFRQNVHKQVHSPNLVAQITKWIAECRDVHVNCSARSGPEYRLPTRLLQVSSHSISLIETRPKLSTIVQYTTLSHRWPKVPGFKLMRDTQALLKKGVSQESLPVLFRDFCQLSLSLGYHYVWIDALCIIQDDRQDWTREAGRMVDVYVNSQLNVIAGASQQHESLFLERNPLTLIPCLITGSKLSQALNLQAVFTFNSDEIGQIARLATDSRAWILQECELSPRMIYFGDTECVWECSSRMQCESSLEGGVNWTIEEDSVKPKNIRSQLARFQQDYIGLSEARCHSIWTGLVCKYTSLDVTFESDRLVAISGLSQYLYQVVKDQLGEYHAGLWEVGFEKQLMWRTYYNSGIKPSSHYLAPSWSWASHVSRISYYGSSPGARSVSSFIESLTISTTPISSTATHGKVQSGRFMCMANICRLYLTQNPSSRTFFWFVESSPICNITGARSPLSIHVCLDRPDKVQVQGNSKNVVAEFLLIPLFCYDLSDYGQPYIEKPRIRKLFTYWQLETLQDKRSQYVFPRGRWGNPSEQKDHYAMAALVVSPAAGIQGHYVRSGIAEFSSPDTISLLQQACMQTSLPFEQYLHIAADRYAYEVAII